MARPILAIILAITLTFATATQAEVATPLDQPLWSELTPQQRQVLAPLAKDWDATEPFRRKKWVGIAQRYPSMTPEQQQRVQGQMKTWANMSPEERNVARQKFKQLNKASTLSDCLLTWPSLWMEMVDGQRRKVGSACWDIEKATKLCAVHF